MCGQNVGFVNVKLVVQIVTPGLFKWLVANKDINATYTAINIARIRRKEK
jgi:hypothetical protein